MRRVLTAFCLAATVLVSATAVRPYTLQFTDSSNTIQMKWPTHAIKVAFSSSLSAPQSNIKSGSDVVGAARRALDHWRAAANIRFIIFSSEVQSISSPGTRGDGLSLITVAHTSENAAPFTGEGSEMSGRTRVFSTVGGVITESDVVLNPGQLYSADGTPGTYDLEAVFTHEIGHLLGLEHSGVLGATMQPRQARNGIYDLPSLSPRTLSDDDRAGARAIYGQRLGMRTRGAIAGTINFASGAPVFGANIWAEEASSGRVVASNITLTNGAYRIDGLLPGKYRLIAQSLDGTIFASEIASQRGGYAGLALSKQLTFRAEEIGVVNIKPGTTTVLNAQLAGSPSLVIPSFLGINKELSTVAVPLVPGSRYRIYVAGEGINVTQLAPAGITTTSPFVSVDPSSIANADFGDDLSVISFDVSVAIDAPAGEYSLRLESLTGEVAYIAGGLTIDGAESIAEAEQNDALVAEASFDDDELGAVAIALQSVPSAAIEEAPTPVPESEAATRNLEIATQLQTVVIQDPNLSPISATSLSP